MKKSARKIKRNHRCGKNVFGERCIEKFVTLEKDTAITQYLEILDDLEANKGKRIEYTIAFYKDLTKSEIHMLSNKMAILAKLRAAANAQGFFARGLDTYSSVA